MIAQQMDLLILLKLVVYRVYLAFISMNRVVNDQILFILFCF